MFGSKDLLFSSEKYGVAKSLRFRSGSTTYLNRTFSAGNRTTWTWSGWIKRGALGGGLQSLFVAIDATASNYTQISFNNDVLYVYDNPMISGGVVAATSAVYRDVSAWMHIVVLFDTTNATPSDRMRVYINGSRVTVFATNNISSISSGATTYLNSAVQHNIGNRQPFGNALFDGYLAEVNFIDGQALTPSAFGFYDNNGIWQPKGYTGTYGTNGFYLKFTDVGATSGANTGYGKDFSGFNTNYWTTNNFNSTSTSTSYDSMYDSPVNASNGITGIGNYAVLNPVGGFLTGGTTLSDANLGWSLNRATYSGWTAATMTLPTSGKWYWEVIQSAVTGTATLSAEIGIISATTPNSTQWPSATSRGIYLGNGNKETNQTFSTYGSAFALDEVLNIAVDMDNGNIYFGKNGSWGNGTGSFNQTFSSAAVAFSDIVSSGVTWCPAVGNNGATTNTGNINFGQRPFANTIPSGYSALNTQNLTTPTITNGASYMAAVTYQGATAPNTVTTSSTNSGNNPLGMAFQPDLVWIKSRSAATDNKWTDVVRGTTKALISNTTGTETTDTNGLTAFTTSGFTVGSDTTYNNTTGPATYVAWEWKAGGTAVSGTGTGSITNVSYSADQTAGFSIIKYTGSGTAGATITHGLGAAPSFVIAKTRDLAAKGWTVYHKANGAGGYTVLSSTAAYTADTNMWYNTAPSSSVIYFGTDSWNNSSGSTYVCYAWAPIAGYSAFGSYTGNGSTDGPFIYTGFRPRWIMVKQTSAAGESWYIFDTSRDTYNVTQNTLQPNQSNAEAGGSARYFDILSNGFKARTSDGAFNLSSGTYIYAAFAENPFKISRAR